MLKKTAQYLHIALVAFGALSCSVTENLSTTKGVVLLIPVG